MNCSDRAMFSYVLLILSPFFLPSRSPAAEPVRLTTDGTLKLSPVFEGRGDAVVFATQEKPNLVAIVRLDLRDGTRRRVHPKVSSHQFDPAFSPDARFHAYAMSLTAPQMGLVIQDTREKTEASYRPRDSRATARNPSIAPGGSAVIFSVSDVDGHQIASVGTSGKDFKLLTHSAGMNAWPAYSPDGKTIAFGSSRAGDFEIFAMSADGSNPRRLTTSPALDARPAWSPDGKRLAFTSNRDGNYEIYAMSADGSRPTNLTRNPARDDYPAWHPDGKRLLFVSDRDGGSDLYMLTVP